MLSAWISIPTKTIVFIPPVVYITFNYNATIDLASQYIQFTPSDSLSSPGLKYFYLSPTATLTLSAPYNNLPTLYYPPS